MSSKKFYPLKGFKSDLKQRSSRKIFTTNYACRNADLNLTVITGTTNGFIFQTINLLMGSLGVRLTCLDCNGCYLLRKCDKGDNSDTWNNDIVYSTANLLNKSITLFQSPCIFLNIIIFIDLYCANISLGKEIFIRALH